MSSHANTYYIVPGEHLDDIGSAIRTKLNSPNTYYEVKDMAGAIESISASSELGDAKFHTSYSVLSNNGGVKVSTSCTQIGKVTTKGVVGSITDTDVISSNIKSGVNIFGVTGNLKELPSFNEKQKNNAATVDHVLNSKYFIDDGGNIKQGTMEAASFYAYYSEVEGSGVKEIVIANENYNTSYVGNGAIKNYIGGESIKPYIKSGVQLFGVEGNCNPPCKVTIEAENESEQGGSPVQISYSNWDKESNSKYSDIEIAGGQTVTINCLQDSMISLRVKGRTKSTVSITVKSSSNVEPSYGDPSSLQFTHELENAYGYIYYRSLLNASSMTLHVILRALS